MNHHIITYDDSLGYFFQICLLTRRCGLWSIQACLHHIKQITNSFVFVQIEEIIAFARWWTRSHKGSKNFWWHKFFKTRDICTQNFSRQYQLHFRIWQFQFFAHGQIIGSEVFKFSASILCFWPTVQCSVNSFWGFFSMASAMSFGGGTCTATGWSLSGFLFTRSTYIWPSVDFRSIWYFFFGQIPRMKI